MADYSFMKTGFDNVQDAVDAEELKKNVVSLVLTLSKNAMKTAVTYITHSKRNAITPEDLKRSMMLEMFFYKQRPDLFQEAEKIKEEIFDSGYEEDSESDEDDDGGSLIGEGEADIFADSKCTCAMCTCLNGIYTRRNKWQPASEYEKLFKKHIENMN